MRHVAHKNDQVVDDCVSLNGLLIDNLKKETFLTGCTQTDMFHNSEDHTWSDSHQRSDAEYSPVTASCLVAPLLVTQILDPTPTLARTHTRSCPPTLPPTPTHDLTTTAHFVHLDFRLPDVTLLDFIPPEMVLLDLTPPELTPPKHTLLELAPHEIMPPHLNPTNQCTHRRSDRSSDLP